MPLTGTVIRNAIKDIDKSQDFCDELAKAITKNLDITIPSQKVITTVTGGLVAGAPTPAVGIKNITPIKCEVK